MRSIVVLMVLSMVTVACGGTQAPLPEQADAAPEDAGAAPAEPTDTAPSPGGERGALLDLLRAHRGENPDVWPQEMTRVLEPGQLQPLLGMTRDELVAQLGAPDADATYQAESRLAWDIGVLPVPNRSHAPVLVVDVDAGGVATAANFDLAR